jgi:hypothetical protein
MIGGVVQVTLPGHGCPHSLDQEGAHLQHPVEPLDTQSYLVADADLL